MFNRKETAAILLTGLSLTLLFVMVMTGCGGVEDMEDDFSPENPTYPAEIEDNSEWSCEGRSPVGIWSTEHYWISGNCELDDYHSANLRTLNQECETETHLYFDTGCWLERATTCRGRRGYRLTILEDRFWRSPDYMSGVKYVWFSYVNSAGGVRWQCHNQYETEFFRVSSEDQDPTGVVTSGEWYGRE